MDLQCIICIANTSYAVKTPKEEVACNTHWNFYKKFKIWTFPSDIRMGDFEIKWDRRQPLKTGVSHSRQKGWNICTSVLSSLIIIIIKLDYLIPATNIVVNLASCL